MKTACISVVLFAAATGLLACCARETSRTPSSAPVAGDPFQSHFEVARSHLSPTGRSRCFILEPGWQMVYEGREDGQPARLVVTMLPETRLVDGVETRVVEERETVADELREVSRNFFAMDPGTGDVYYFGEEVDIYKDGRIAGHGGSWLAGVNGARFGLAISGLPRVGQRYYQEVAPGLAMDRAEVVSTSVSRDVPAGKFKDCIRTAETTPLEPETREYKLYAPGVGLIQDGDLLLVRYGPTGPARD